MGGEGGPRLELLADDDPPSGRLMLMDHVRQSYVWLLRMNLAPAPILWSNRRRVDRIRGAYVIAARLAAGPTWWVEALGSRRGDFAAGRGCRG